jgi:hypothetical protein
VIPLARWYLPVHAVPLARNRVCCHARAGHEGRRLGGMGAGAARAGLRLMADAIERGEGIGTVGHAEWHIETEADPLR